MNYEQALEKLQKPRNQKQKKVAPHTKLLLHPDRSISLVLYSTAIVTWYPDGGVCIYGSSTTNLTYHRTNQFLPAGWRFIRLGNYNILDIHDNSDWTQISCIPLASNRIIDKYGHAPTLGPVNEENAFTLHQGINSYTSLWVDAFFHGQISYKRTLDITLERALQLVKEIELVPDLVDYSVISLSAIIDMFWKENFPHSRPSKTQKGLVSQLEYNMRTGLTSDRPVRGDPLWIKLKRGLASSINRRLHEALGFEFV